MYKRNETVQKQKIYLQSASFRIAILNLLILSFLLPFLESKCHLFWPGPPNSTADVLRCSHGGMEFLDAVQLGEEGLGLQVEESR